MLLLNKLLGGGLLPGLRVGIQQSSRGLFGKRKKEKDELDETDKELQDDREGFDLDEDEEVDDDEERSPEQIDPDSEDGAMVDPRFIKRSSKLYKKFLENQDRPMLTKDGYQFNVGLIMHRLPIFLGYNSDIVKSFKQRYELIRRTEYYNVVPQELSENKANPMIEFERSSSDNMITHQKGTGQDRQIYAEHSKYWRLVDPNIQDPRSIQYKPNDMLFLVVKNEAGEWVFPDWTVREKENFDTIKKGIAKDITGNVISNLHWLSELPIFVYRRDIDGLPRGKGIKTFYYHAVHISGRFEQNPQKRSLWKDYMWAPKAQLASLMQPQYFKKLIRSAPSVL